MKALRVHEASGPRGLRIDDVPAPEPRTGEAIVAIQAAALNRRDVFITQGLYPNLTFPTTLGSDGCGELVAVDGACAVSIGSDVVIDPMLGWGADPRVWDAVGSSILGMPRDGTFAQYVAVPANNVYAKPRGLSPEAAAAVPLAGLTAYRALVTRGCVRAGETVLITGVGGGVQTFVLLFAKRLGARAIVTSASDEKLERARAMGADVTLNYATMPDWHKRARAAGPVDLVVDSSGGDTPAKALDLLRPGGRLVIYGATNGEATIRPFSLFWRHLTIAGTSMGSPEDFAAMLELFEDGALQPAIDRTYEFGDAVEAFERMAQSEQFGKIVLRVP